MNGDIIQHTQHLHPRLNFSSPNFPIRIRIYRTSRSFTAPVHPGLKRAEEPAFRVRKAAALYVDCGPCLVRIGIVVGFESRENAGIGVEGGMLDDAENWKGIRKMEEQMWGKRIEWVGMVVGLRQIHSGR